MALINEISFFVVEENLDRPVTVTAHPVENGVSITDHVKAEPATLNLSGQISGADAKQVLDTLRGYQLKGLLVTYIGNVILQNAVIKDFSTTHNAKIRDGMDFTMLLQEIRVAKSKLATGRYSGTLNIGQKLSNGTQQPVSSGVKNRYHKIKNGETLSGIAKKYKNKGVTVAKLKNHNKNRDVFRPGQKRKWNQLRIGASLFLGRY